MATLSSLLSQLPILQDSQKVIGSISEADESPELSSNSLSKAKASSGHSPNGFLRNGRIEFSQLQTRRISVNVESYKFAEKITLVFGFDLPIMLKRLLRRYPFRVTYSSVTFSNYTQSLDPESSLYFNVKRRLKIILPMASFQIQTSSIPWSLTSYPIAPCQSQIFAICADGNLDTVKKWFKNSSASPFVVNQHGENLLHVSLSGHCLHL